MKLKNITSGLFVGITGLSLLTSPYIKDEKRNILEAMEKSEKALSGWKEVYKQRAERRKAQEIKYSNKPKNISETGLNLIKQYEGFRPKAYSCPAGVWTIGYGTTQNVKSGDKITEEQAEQKLNDYIKTEVEKTIRENVFLPLNQSQTDAIGSFIYNIGPTKFPKSTLLKKLNEWDHEGAAQEFKRWNKANGKVLAGLRNRRAAEEALFRK